MAAVPLLLVVGGVLAVVFMRQQGGAPDDSGLLDADLCPLAPAGIAASAAVVLDTGKPLADAPLPSAVLRTVSLKLAANTELRVYAVRTDAETPLASLGRLCKPYHGGDLSVAAAKDQRDANRDCDDLPVQLTPFLRDAAQRFCLRRNQLEAEVDELVRAAPRRTVAASYMIDALREAAGELAARPRPRTLYVYSDMLEHTAAYSHIDLEWTRWRTVGEPSAGEREGQRLAGEPPPRMDEPSAEDGADSLDPTSVIGMAAEVFYLPREGITEPLRPRRVHQDYWRAFFAGAAVTFVDFESAPRYAALPLMEVAATANQGEDDQALEEELARIEQLRERIAEETAALAAQRDQSAATLEQLVGDANGNATADEASAQEATAAGPSEVEDETTAAAAEAAGPSGAGSDALPDNSPSGNQPAAAPSPTRLASSDEVDAPQRPLPEPTLPEAVPLALPAAPSASPSPSELAAAGGDSLSPCPLALSPTSLALLTPEGYPNDRQVHYGAGVVVVDYAVDEGGTVAADVLLRPELSSSTMPENFDALVADTVEQVRAWRFDFAVEDNCAKPQRQTATFNYASRCVGAPRPSCRTVRTSVTPR